MRTINKSTSTAERRRKGFKGTLHEIIKTAMRSKQRSKEASGKKATETRSLYLTQRVKEFGCLPPPESSIFMGDHIMGLVLIKFIVERHLIQETIYLPTRRKNPSHTFT